MAANFKIVSFTPKKTVVARGIGDWISCHVVVKNVGDEAGYYYLRVTDDGEPLGPEDFSDFLNPEQERDVTVDLTYPEDARIGQHKICAMLYW